MNTTRAACFSAACFILMGFLLTVTGPAHAEEDLLFTHIPLVGSEQDCKLAGGCGKDFSLSLADIDKDFILVELFSMYCPICQGAAGNVNKLHELIEKSPFASRMLMLGAGADNSRYEVDFFKKKYSVPFGLFSDPGLAVYEASKANGTPYFLLLQKVAPGKLKLLYSHSGKFDDPEVFFNTLLQKAQLAG